MRVLKLIILPLFISALIISSSSIAATTYSGTITLIGNARQDGSPAVKVSINGVLVGTATISANVHTGQLGQYSLRYTSSTKPQTLDISLDGYTTVEQKYVAVDLWHVNFDENGDKSVDLIGAVPSSVKVGQAQVSPTEAALFTNGAIVEFNVSQIGDDTALKASLLPGQVGVNVGGQLSSVDPEIIFVDAFKQSSPWSIRDKWVNPKNPVPENPGVSSIDSNGWVSSLAYNQQAEAAIYQSGDGKYPAGVYTVLYDGEGTFAFSEGTQVVSQAPGRILINVTPISGPTSGIRVILTATNPANYARNIRVILPGFESTYTKDIWYPPFIAMLKPFNTVRFMPWLRANRSMEVNWSDRRAPTYATQAGPNTYTASVDSKGVSFEYIIALANKLNVNPWINVPVAASDDYIRQMAHLFHTTLNSNLHPMIEYSNEIWNQVFPYSYQYMQTQGLNLKLTNNASVAPYYFYGLRLSQIFDIWNAEYGLDKGLLIHVVASQGDWTTEPDDILSFGQQANRLADKADVIAMGGYVEPYAAYSQAIRSGQMTWAKVASMSPAQLERDMISFIDNNLSVQFKNMHTEAKKWGLGLVVYEGGDGNESSSVPPSYNAAVTNLYIETARDPGMQTVYTHLLDTWKAAGGTLFNQFDTVNTPSMYGQWGMLEYQLQPLATSQKYVALMNWMKK